MKTLRKVLICLHCIFVPPENVLPCKAMLVRYQLLYATPSKHNVS